MSIFFSSMLLLSSAIMTSYIVSFVSVQLHPVLDTYWMVTSDHPISFSNFFFLCSIWNV